MWLDHCIDVCLQRVHREYLRTVLPGPSLSLPGSDLEPCPCPRHRVSKTSSVLSVVIHCTDDVIHQSCRAKHRHHLRLPPLAPSLLQTPSLEVRSSRCAQNDDEQIQTLHVEPYGQTRSIGYSDTRLRRKR